ncbi:MAG: PAS domain S-box protein [Candidatus Viridilinea halotolerans]|uniref:histidine kinase n=1 Tax=Candidatus Viridilinea halotolerans TaxID=2491704 RepID=A0A426TRH6_9CHLR|nr:MAG: PAS domain S-box protein [Candidatus Viridilinea halotolerans]
MIVMVLPIPPAEAVVQPTLESLFDCWRRFFLGQRNHEVFSRDLLNALAAVTHATQAALLIYDSEQQILNRVAAVGVADESALHGRVALGEGMAGWVAQQRQPLLLPLGATVPAHIVRLMAQEGLTSVLCLPMEVDGHLCGVLSLARSGTAPPFTSEDLRFATLIADRQAIALQMVRLYAELDRSESFINRILESIPVSLIVIDQRLNIVAANQNFLTKSRRAQQQTVGKPIAAVLPPVFLAFTRLEERLRTVFASGQPFEGDKLSYRAPGLSAHTYYYRLVPLKRERTVEHVLLLMEDITEREQLSEEVRRVERHLASVIDCASDLVISLSPAGRIVTWNRAAERVSGLNEEQVRDEMLVNLCAIDQRRTLTSLLKRLIAGEDVAETEINLLTANPWSEVPVAWNCSAMHDDYGRLVAIVAVGRDLTERRRLEAQIIQSAKIASLGVMAGGIAHELRNPLAIISASAQLIEENRDNPELQQQATRRIIASAERASLTIEHLLRFAHPPQERYRLINANAVLDDVLTMMDHQLVSVQINLHCELSPELPLIYGNPELLAQVFTNMILNACSAMPQGGDLAITTGVKGEYVLVRFTDTGTGIPREHIPKIFDPFFTTRAVGQGTGLGLSISYSIVRQHHGTIEVQSEVGLGTSFEILLPVHEA